MFNRLSIYLFIFCLFCNIANADQSLSYKDALSQRLISSTLYGLIGGSHEGQSINADVQNRSGKAITIKVDAGQVLLPSDTNVQSMMVTEELSVTIEPGKIAKIKLYAYCIENSDAGPGVQDTFNPGPIASGGLLTVAQLFNDKKYHGIAAQDVIWSVSDGNSLESIVAEDEKLTNEFRQLVASITKQPYVAYKAAAVPLPEKYIIRTTRTVADPYRLFTGGVSMQAPPQTDIRIVLVDEFGKELRELYNVKSGNDSKQLDFSFELDGRTLDKKLYFVRYYIGGQKIRDIPVNNQAVKGFGF